MRVKDVNINMKNGTMKVIFVVISLEFSIHNFFENFMFTTFMVPLFIFTTTKETFSKIHSSLSGKRHFHKSLIQFGHKIDEPNRQELRDILRIQNLGGMGSNLGLPENLGGSKI